MNLLTPIKKLEIIRKLLILITFIAMLSCSPLVFAADDTPPGSEVTDVTITPTGGGGNVPVSPGSAIRATAAPLPETPTPPPEYSEFNLSNIGNIDAAQMLVNLKGSVGNLMQLTTAIAYVLGMFFVIKGIFGLKEYGEQRTHGGSQAHGSLKGALACMFVGGALLFLPSSVGAGISTFWGTPSPLSYVTSDSDPWSEVISSVFLVVQLIGTIAFIRGLIILTHTGEGHQQGAFGRAMAHIVGGILCINMYAFIQVVLNTLLLGK